MPQGQRTLTEVDGVVVAGLEEPNAKGAKEGADADAEMEVGGGYNLTAGGFFG